MTQFLCISGSIWFYHSFKFWWTWSDVSCDFRFRVSDVQLFMYLFSASTSNITMKPARPLPSGDWWSLFWNDWTKEASCIRTWVQTDAWWGWAPVEPPRWLQAGGGHVWSTVRRPGVHQTRGQFATWLPLSEHTVETPCLAVEVVVHAGYQTSPKCRALKQWQSFVHKSTVWQSSVWTAHFSSIQWAGVTGAGGSASRTVPPRAVSVGLRPGCWSPPRGPLRGLLALPHSMAAELHRQELQSRGSSHKAICHLTVELSGSNSTAGIEGIYGHF